MASAMTLVIIGGGFDLSVAAIFAVAGVAAAWVALNLDPYVGLLVAPLVGAALGLINGVVITRLNVHSFLATIATSLVFKGVAIVISDGRLIPVRIDEFTWLGRDKFLGVFIAVYVLAAFALILTFVLNRATLGRKIFSVGGNEEAAILSGIRTDRVKIATFVIAGLAAGLAAAISVSRISMGQASAGAGMELQAIAAVILGGTSIYGGVGAVWRSVAGVQMLLALINNGFNILNADPFYRDLTTGLVAPSAPSASAPPDGVADGGKRIPSAESKRRTARSLQGRARSVPVITALPISSSTKRLDSRAQAAFSIASEMRSRTTSKGRARPGSCASIRKMCQPCRVVTGSAVISRSSKSAHCCFEFRQRIARAELPERPSS